jgi:bacterioferritin-associated ferredoxin
LNVIEDEIIAAIRTRGAKTVRELKDLTGAGDGCMCCRSELRHYLTVYAAARVVELAPA